MVVVIAVVAEQLRQTVALCIHGRGIERHARGNLGLFSCIAYKTVGFGWKTNVFEGVNGEEVTEVDVVSDFCLLGILLLYGLIVNCCVQVAMVAQYRLCY